MVFAWTSACVTSGAAVVFCANMTAQTTANRADTSNTDRSTFMIVLALQMKISTLNRVQGISESRNISERRLMKDYERDLRRSTWRFSSSNSSPTESAGHKLASFVRQNPRQSVLSRFFSNLGLPVAAD